MRLWASICSFVRLVSDLCQYSGRATWQNVAPAVAGGCAAWSWQYMTMIPKQIILCAQSRDQTRYRQNARRDPPQPQPGRGWPRQVAETQWLAPRQWLDLGPDRALWRSPH